MGVLGIDFDSPQARDNTLASGNSVELLGSGDSQATPLTLGASTAVGDSGGPAFVRTLGYWRLHGVVSYGTSESEYGDVTVYTRLASHYDWLISELPDWPDSKIFEGSGGWKTRGLVHLFPIRVPGVFISILDGFTFLFSKGNSFWAWSNLVQKWVWLSDQAYPFIYCYSPSNSFWMYVLLDSSNGQLIRAYNYSSTEWGNYGG